LRQSLRYAINGVFLVFIILLLIVPRTMGQDAFSGRIIEIIAGDQLRVRLDTLETTVYLHGVEVPQTPEALARRAKEYTERRVAGTIVRVEVRGTGPNRQFFGEVFPATPNGGSLNKELIRVGLATWAQNYAPKRDDLARLEQEARNANRGMWGDSEGRNIPLPPFARDSAPAKNRMAPDAQSVKPVSDQDKTESEPISPLNVPLSDATIPVRQRMPDPPPATWEQRFQSLTYNLSMDYMPPEPARAFRFMLPIMLLGGGIVGGLTFFYLLRFGENRAGSLSYKIIYAVFTGIAGACLTPLPTLLVSRYLPGTRDSALVAICLPLGVWFWRKSLGLFQRDRILRATPARQLADERMGLVRVSGETVAPNGLTYSAVGKLPAIYLREMNYRYNPQTDAPYDRSRNSLPHRWELMKDDVRAVDFVIRDETGEVNVIADRGEFHPLRVARYYNDIPVESFPAPPYAGDTKTEIYFLPERALVTVWGRRYRTASPIPGHHEERVGYDPVAQCLIIVEGAYSRLFSRKPFAGMLLAILATLSFGLAAYCILTPADAPPIRFTISEYVKGFRK